MTTDPRSQILGSIRRALRRGPLDGPAREAAERRLATHQRNLVPKRTDVDADALVALFAEQAEAVSATVVRLGSIDEVPDAVADYLAGHNLPSAVKVAPDPSLAGVPWERRPTIEVAQGRAEDEDLTGVTGAFAAIAETGTLMLASGEEHPTTLNFMPDNHIVVVRRDQIVGPYEDAWDRLRRQDGMPRTVNFVTGPSRTGDIEQKIQLGAHGPRRLHILLVDAPED
ncbi:MAG TPA: lactate utilization protein [Alphaproteobacteria bacterium]|nr:lactate utilization protein [Alphaproteobacteria bacterium]